MQLLLSVILICAFICLTNSVISKTAMTNNYPQIAVLGCDSNKANLYYDIERQVWVEDLVSSCIKDEESILKFCQKAYPSLYIGNYVRIERSLRFENWCKLLPSMDKNTPLCRTESSMEQVVRPYRCLHNNSKDEELISSNPDCIMNSFTDVNKCLRAEKWEQYATLDCSNKTMVLNSSIMTTDWCGLAQFHGIEYVCCPLKDSGFSDDYETSYDEKDDNILNEDDSIKELIIVPKSSTAEPSRKIIAMSLGSNEPNWIQDYQQWNTGLGDFPDDEDETEDQDKTKFKVDPKSPLTLSEHERFSNEKEQFKRKYKEQIDQLKSRWQKRQNEIQLLANKNPIQAQTDYENAEIEFRQEYYIIKQTANDERTRINELHENNLDNLLDNAKIETNQKLINAWNEKPLKTENVEDALYNYLDVLLHDRIHLVNRYERLRVVDPEQAKRKRVSIHERLRTIANQINSALSKLRRYSKLQSKIQPRINRLISDYDEVNQAAYRLVSDYLSSISTASQNQGLPLGRDENKIYPYPPSQTDNLEDDYNTNAEYNDDDYDSSTVKTNKIDDGRSNWDVGVDTDVILDVKIDADENRPYKNMNRTRSLFVTYLPYIIGILFVLCLIFGIIIIRFIIKQRRKYQHGENYEKNYVFSEVNSCSAEEKALHALQINGYENPTYRFFESQTPKC